MGYRELLYSTVRFKVLFELVFFGANQILSFSLQILKEEKIWVSPECEMIGFVLLETDSYTEASLRKTVTGV